MYSFEQLKIFITVCDTGSFSAAARKLQRAQSGVSQAIANLEIAINQELFNRENNKPTLTENGMALLPIARTILNQQKFFDQKVEALQHAHEHELVIAIDESLVNHALLEQFTNLADAFPITQFDIITATTFDVENLVRQGKAQLGIVLADGELKVDMDFFTLGQARFVTFAAKDHPLAQLPIVYDSDLKNHRQLVLRSAERKELWFSYAISTQLWFANSHQVLADLACKGIGWANLPQQMIQDKMHDGQLVALPVSHEFDGWMTTVGCLVSRSRGMGPVLKKVVASLKQYRYQAD